ncbi:uncharacterized protein N0V89_004892 [Didymosphaeria variabile]|uniref:Transcription factor domain-containing protein n=1 Tax=Didymosphaeria variabile TaxID=1932322 RepID=A0A9W8XTD3_9PLEO|nr:uncharacterized protein N0V89_004892 [Didymosphaeria variabile]KAJ4356855.1 hypothetical protein N0V89_004892 [Didymosphaeria variabile]
MPRVFDLSKDPPVSRSEKSAIAPAVTTDVIHADSASTTESRVPQIQSPHLSTNPAVVEFPATSGNQRGLRTDVLTYEFDEPFFSFNDQDWFCDKGAGAFTPKLWPPMLSDSDNALRNNTSTDMAWDDWSVVDDSSPSPTCDLLLCSPALALNYFAETICERLYACESLHNPIRSISIFRARHSPLFNSLLRYLTATYLSKSTILDQTRCLLSTVQKETLHHIGNEVDLAKRGDQFGLHIGIKARKAAEEALLALIMFGLASSWDGSNNTGIAHYRTAVSLYTETCASMAFVSRRFYAETLIYWWAGLSFVTNVEIEPLPDPPPCQDIEDGPNTYTDEYRLFYPHPLTGISPRAHLLLGKVASLVYSQRIRAMRPSFLSSERLKQDESILQTSYQLEEDLLSLHIPQPTDLPEVNDTNTSINDLRNMAEAYRLSGLLMLYRCFPDLLRNRRGDLRNQDASEQWLCALALHTLGILERNSPNSRTRSIEQIVLVIIAGEICHPLHHGIASSVERNTYSQFLQSLCDSWSAAGSLCSAEDVPRPFLEGAGLLSDEGFLDLPPILPVAEGENEMGAEDVANIIQRARHKVSHRLTTVREILPYRSVEQGEELIHDIWERDRTHQGAFWMDVMIKNGWTFILV